MAGSKPQLGAPTVYPDHYDPGLLVAIPRAQGRAQLHLPGNMAGADLWTAFEVSWLTPGGKPQVAVAEFRVPCTSPNIVESKSFKLYLNSLNQTCFATWDEVVAVLARDLGGGFGAAIGVKLFTVDDYGALGVTRMEGSCLDSLEIDCANFHPDGGLLALRAEAGVDERVYSHLLKTNCPVTGQPDWATLAIAYRGRGICHRGLLRYLVSFRQHQDFHEHCVERIFADILSQCAPEYLSVYARYTRRGGLDINPFRSTHDEQPPWCRIARQ